MAGIVTRPPAAGKPDSNGAAVPPLEDGERLDQKTFHARYEAMPEDFRAELIGGIVYVSSPAKPLHGRGHYLVIGWLATYEEATPGTDGLSDTTDIMSSETEVQPDALLRLLPEYGGQMRVNDDGYLEGAAELTAEVSASSESKDLHLKKEVYEKAGVQEYVVIALRLQRVFWFVRRNDQFEELAAGPDGIFRSEVFPGLWLDPDAILRKDITRVLEVVRQGLASPEHVAFVAALASRRK